MEGFFPCIKEIALLHGGMPHIKTRDGAIYHFAKAHDADIIRLYLHTH
jgi:hypothetical protein